MCVAVPVGRRHQAARHPLICAWQEPPRRLVRFNAAASLLVLLISGTRTQLSLAAIVGVPTPARRLELHHA
jgi:hypothetical protein